MSRLHELNEIAQVISRSERAALRVLLTTFLNDKRDDTEIPRTIWKLVACRPTHHLQGLIELGTEMIR